MSAKKQSSNKGDDSLFEPRFQAREGKKKNRGDNKKEGQKTETPPTPPQGDSDDDSEDVYTEYAAINKNDDNTELIEYELNDDGSNDNGFWTRWGGFVILVLILVIGLLYLWGRTLVETPIADDNVNETATEEVEEVQ